MRGRCDQCGVRVSVGRNGTRRGNLIVCDRCRGFVRDSEGFAWRLHEVLGMGAVEHRRSNTRERKRRINGR